MPLISISDIQVNFPFEPYACQLVYMQKVIEGLRTGKNAILESPTGTGKTLCLLCASLAWLQNRKAQIGNKAHENGSVMTNTLKGGTGWSIDGKRRGGQTTGNLHLVNNKTTVGWNIDRNNEDNVIKTNDGFVDEGWEDASHLLNLNVEKGKIDENVWIGNFGVNAKKNENTAEESSYKNEMSKRLDKAAGQWNGETVFPKIIYASRTHSQLNQAIQELKRTSYSYMKVSIVGSRDQLCVHPTVSKETNHVTKVHMCKNKVKSRSCHYYNNVESMKVHASNEIMDIEDLVISGRKNGVCPYFLAREMKSDADIIFTPYNYILDPKSRRAQGIDLNGNIIIFDEAHNLERICEDSNSFDLSNLDLASALADLQRIITITKEWEDNNNSSFSGATNSNGSNRNNVFNNSASEAHFSHENSLASKYANVSNQDFSLDDALRLKKILLDLEDQLDNIELGTEECKVLKGSVVLNMFTSVGISGQSKRSVQEVVDKMSITLNNDDSSSVLGSKGLGLSKFSDILEIIFGQDDHGKHQEHAANDFKAYLKLEQKKRSEGFLTTSCNKSSRVLSYWCFNPGYTMSDLQRRGARMVILTSGTLSPLKSFISEFGMDFPIRLENPHVINSNQVFICSVENGPDNIPLTSVYNNRSNIEYLKSLGNSIVNFSRIIPRGLLVFFPSYSIMENSIEFWKSSGLYGRIEMKKQIFIEPKSKKGLMDAMTLFYEKVNDFKLHGAIFMAVCRGKVSEGLDFADNNGRGVIITGLPFPPMFDPKVKLKMQFLDENKKKGISGQEWYKLQASRAVNQAIGRVIRHSKDFGAILLCDLRFSRSIQQLPIWLRSVTKTFNNFGLAQRELINFFKVHEQSVMEILYRPVNQSAINQSTTQSINITNNNQSIISTNHQPKLSSLERSNAICNHLQAPKTCEELLNAYGEDDKEILKEQYDEWSHPKNNNNNKFIKINNNNKDQINVGNNWDNKAINIQILDENNTKNNKNNNINNAKLFSALESTEKVFEASTSKHNNNETTNSQKNVFRKTQALTEILIEGQSYNTQSFLEKVKTILSKRMYLCLKQAMVQYKASHDVTHLVSCMKKTLSWQHHKFVLLGLSKLVRPYDQDEFHMLCIAEHINNNNNNNILNNNGDEKEDEIPKADLNQGRKKMKLDVEIGVMKFNNSSTLVNHHENTNNNILNNNNNLNANSNNATANINNNSNDRSLNGRGSRGSRNGRNAPAKKVNIKKDNNQTHVKDFFIKKPQTALTSPTAFSQTPTTSHSTKISSLNPFGKNKNFNISNLNSNNNHINNIHNKSEPKRNEYNMLNSVPPLLKKSISDNVESSDVIDKDSIVITNDYQTISMDNQSNYNSFSNTNVNINFSITNTINTTTNTTTIANKAIDHYTTDTTTIITANNNNCDKINIKNTNINTKNNVNELDNDNSFCAHMYLQPLCAACKTCGVKRCRLCWQNTIKKEKLCPNCGVKVTKSSMEFAQ